MVISLNTCSAYLCSKDEQELRHHFLPAYTLQRHAENHFISTSQSALCKICKRVAYLTGHGLDNAFDRIKHY